MTSSLALPPIPFVALQLRRGYNCSMKKKYSIKTEYGAFQAAIWYDKRDSTYLVETIGFDRTMTFGKSLAEAKRMAKELIELLVESTMDEGNAVVDSNMRVVGKKIKPESILQLQHA